MNWGVQPPTPRQFQPCYYLANSAPESENVLFAPLLKTGVAEHGNDVGF